MKKTILVAGGTGNLGERIVRALIKRDADVTAVVRSTTDPVKIKMLEQWGVKVFRVSSWNVAELTRACSGMSCVVSVLAGLREVIIDAQKILLDAAIAAGVPRIIPSDYSLDFTKFSNGENRNLDLRREFHAYLDNTPIASTSIFNGAFADLLTGQMPLIHFKQKLILFWGRGDFKWNFTTMDDTATYTSYVAVDSSTPRYLRIAGDQISPREIRAVVSEVTHQKFKLLRTGGKALLGLIIKIARRMAPGEKELYPAWQGMQYMHNMIDDRSKIDQLDNNRYPEMHWTSVKDVIAAHLKN